MLWLSRRRLLNHDIDSDDFVPYCRINKDTEGKSEEVTKEAHCLKTPDTVVPGQNHEPNDTRRIP